ncbi:hypothetical protein N7494_013263 [Penicillium frequentans]|uniref:Uncharacterized protein n=1 Tax=Penicillium frequentans TaxID=3151616 RepID=A0AAD6G809_9EURO|nr:hypothetical protein N7494_013282 [Penicillium glabrum]KAJ5522885.1 hypothetical protein N7494_013315 [Penicillium glabrum]KAJ5522949.1 hypothetical protein N7494_013263 [Penicillium glabrum]
MSSSRLSKIREASWVVIFNLSSDAVRPSFRWSSTNNTTIDCTPAQATQRPQYALALTAHSDHHLLMRIIAEFFLRRGCFPGLCAGW